MSALAAVLVGFAALFALVVLHVPIGVAMTVVGACGFGALVGAKPAVTILGSELTSVFSSSDLAVIPVFLLMGAFAGHAGLSADLYRLAAALVGHRRGGLAMATIGGCAGFGALCGSSLATVGTMKSIAYPEMVTRGYAPHFAAGTIAVGGTLGILVPPSIIMVVYAVLTETFVLDLYVAAILPSLLAVALYAAAVAAYAAAWPARAPAGPRIAWPERLHVAGQAWGVVVVVGIVIGGIYAGWFTALEAAAVGAALSFAFLAGRGRLTRGVLMQCLTETAVTTGLIYLMVIGASVFNYFITVSRVPHELVQAIQSAGMAPLTVICIILVAYIVLGAFFDEVATMLISLPMVLPMIKSWGYDPVWWGIVNVTVIMIGLFCPPIGLNVMVMHGMVREVPMRRLYEGVVPYLFADFLRLALLVAFPAIVTWLPALVKR